MSNPRTNEELNSAIVPLRSNGTIVEMEVSMKLLSNGQGLKSVRYGKAPVVSDECSGDGSNWTVASKANLQLANKIGEDNFSLEKESDTIVVVKKCICFRDEGSCTDDPQPQWFKLVPTNVA